MLAFAVTVHLATIVYAVRGGLTAGEVLARTATSWYLAFYVVFVRRSRCMRRSACAMCCANGRRGAGRSLDAALALFALVLLALGLRAVLALYLA